jgi:DNA-binding HxlR family transcriptional regulator
MPAVKTSTKRASRADRPVLALLDLLGRRWLLRVVWELREETLTFRALRARCNAMSPSVLNRRLAELREAGLVEVRSGGGYRLTAEGRALVRSLQPIRRWAQHWATRPQTARRARSARPIR